LKVDEVFSLLTLLDLAIGRGSLPAILSSRSRAENFQFLLDQEGSMRGTSLTSLKAEESRMNPRLWFQLHVDVQATFLILRLAFPEHEPLGIGKQDFSCLNSDDDEDSFFQLLRMFMTE